MTTSLIVPWRSTPEREPLWQFCRQLWEHSGLVDEIVECDSGDPEGFTRGASINRGVEEATGDELILADADTFVSAAGEALDLMRQGAPWVVAYRRWAYYRVSPADTDLYLSRQIGTKLEPTRFLERCVSYSGCDVMTREAFERVGGYPETLRMWGHDDDCLTAALDTLIGPHQRTSGFAVQLFHHHIESERFEQPHIGENRRVSDLYAQARGNPEVMKLLIQSQQARVRRG